ncbi:hypothetical protein ACFV1F_17045 [Streptomyces sp. NPDC059590]|uniref:hypothetical protein n=1 Tax=Streptomyces sp. NPDC059590 TaxID=3346877 RepID=UPI0036983D88
MTRRSGRTGAADSRCPSCRAPVIRQLVEVLTVTADPTPLTPDEQHAARGPNCLIWCLIQRPHSPPRLRWITAWHPPNCPNPHVAEHQCPGPTRQAPLF